MPTWNGTKATFSVAADTKFARVVIDVLDDELRALPVTVALDGITRQGTDDAFSIDYKAAPSEAERLLIEQAVRDHEGILRVDPQATVVNGNLHVEVRPRSGSAYEEYSINWCDPTTWHAEAVPVVGVTLTGDGTTYQIPDLDYRGVLDVVHGKITQENRIADKRLRVYEDGVELPEEEFGWAAYEADPVAGLDNPFEPGVWTCDYATGVITFKAPRTGTITADFHKPTASWWYIQPKPTRSLSLLAVELNATTDVEMRDSVCFVPQIMFAAAAAIGELDEEAASLGITPVAMAGLGITGTPGSLLLASREDDAAPFYAGAAAALGITVEQLKAAQGLPLVDTDFVDVAAEAREYKRIHDFIIESQRAYPTIPKIGGSNERAMSVDWFVWRWPYDEAAARLLVSGNGTRIKIGLKHDVPFRGTYANASVYAISDVTGEGNA